jgi:Peptidase family M23
MERGERLPMSKTESTAVFPTWVWISVFAIAGSASGWLGDAVWSPRTGAIAVLVCECLAIAHLVVRRKRGQAVNSAALALLRAAGLGLLAWLFSLMAWLALEIGLGGRVHLMIEALVGLVAGGLAGWVAFWFAHRQPGIWVERCRKIVLGGAAIGTLLLATLFFLFTGPHDLDRYPPAASSPYLLPWTGGVTRLCIQGNRAIVSHRGWEEFAYDFAMPVGSSVCAARGGTVLNVDVEHDGNGRHADNNLIMVDHGDGTIGWYLHLRQGGSFVKPGQRVRQGEAIGASGNVGMSLLPHLHFDVTDDGGVLLPVTFADVASDAGIPRMFKRYTSGNVFP